MTQPTLHLRFDPEEQDPCVVGILVGMGEASARKVWFRSDSVPLARNGSALLCLGLPPAMEIAAPLKLGAPVSPALLAAMPGIRDMLCEWYPGLAAVPVEAEAEIQAVSPPGRKTALFYSAGVDSSFSLVSERERIDTLVTLIGADIPVADAARGERLRQAARKVAATEGMQCVVVETNIREVFDRLIGWVEYHAAVLAAVAHLLSDDIERVLIASSGDETSWLRPWGSHPGLDPLWGGEGVAIEHHGLVARPAKIAAILDEPLLMALLRVCDYDDDNCGRCPDCRFMLDALEVLDGFDRAPTYKSSDAGKVRPTVNGPSTRSDYLDLLERAREHGGHAALIREIDVAVRQFKWRAKLDEMLRWTELALRFKRFKRRRRYRRAARSAAESRRP